MSYLRISIAADVSIDHDHFEVWRHTADLPLDAVHLVATRVGVGVRDRTYMDPGVTGGTDYYYWARSIDRWGNASPFAACGHAVAAVNAEIGEDRLLGRDSPGRGQVEEIAVTAPLAFTGAESIHLEVSDPGLIGRADPGAGPATGLTVAQTLTLLGFGDPILDKASPGAIGGGTPAVGTFTDLRATGALRFGTYQALSGETVTGYVTIVDDAGATRKLAVVG